MLLLAFVLGLAFAWLTKRIWLQVFQPERAEDRFGSQPDAAARSEAIDVTQVEVHGEGFSASYFQQARTQVGDQTEAVEQVSRKKRPITFLVWLPIGLTMVLWVVAAYIFGRAIWQGHHLHTTAWEFRSVLFATAPTPLAIAVAFLFGALLVWHSEWIRTTVLGPALGARSTSPGSNVMGIPAPIAAFTAIATSAKSTSEQSSSSATKESGAEAKEPYPWMARIVGIAAVTLVSIVAIVAFFPDVITRLEQVKIGGVEARFATSASRSLTVNAQEEAANRSYYELGYWQDIEKTFERLVEPVRQKVLEQAKPTLTTLKYGERVANANRKHDDALSFLRAFAVPLAEVMSCFAEDFQLSDTRFQDSSASLANAWARFAMQTLKTSKAAKGKEEKPEDAAKREARYRKQFDELTRQYRLLVLEIDADLVARDSTCGFDSDDSYPQQRKQRKNVNYFANPTYLGQLNDIRDRLPAVFANGYVITFFSEMVGLTLGTERAIDLLTAVESYLDRDDDLILAQLNFFLSSSRVKTRPELRDYPSASRDLQDARMLVDRLIALLAGEDSSKLKRYYKYVAARVANEQTYNKVEEWLLGHRPTLLELAQLEEWAKELDGWLRSQSLTSLLKGDEIGKLAQAKLMPHIHDTLAMYEMAVGVTRNDLSRERCARSLTLLRTHKDLWEELTRTSNSSSSEFREAMKTFRAHQDIINNACNL